jgi:hypothetical protein
MTTIIKRILIYTAVIVIVFSTFWYFPLPEKKKEFVPLGNVLARYFYYITTATKVDNEVFERFALDTGNVSDQKLRAFYKNFDWSIQSNPIAYRSSGDSSWNQLNSDGSHKDQFLSYWQKVRPLARRLFFENSVMNSVKYPVVHFRCSDSPFNKHNQYHMTKSSSVQWMAGQIKNKGFDEIILLSCNLHRSLDFDSCAKYIEYYSNIFARSGIKVNQQCESIYEDFFTMVYSPLLVSLNSSSFSFMAGVAKDPEDYISCNMGIEINGVYYLQSDGDWILDPNPPLLHKDVRDYHDTISVINGLEHD